MYYLSRHIWHRYGLRFGYPCQPPDPYVCGACLRIREEAAAKYKLLP